MKPMSEWEFYHWADRLSEYHQGHVMELEEMGYSFDYIYSRVTTGKF